MPVNRRNKLDESKTGTVSSSMQVDEERQILKNVEPSVCGVNCASLPSAAEKTGRCSTTRAAPWCATL